MIWVLTAIMAFGLLGYSVYMGRTTKEKIGYSTFWRPRWTIGAAVGALAVAIWIVAANVSFWSPRACEATGEVAGYEAEWTMYTGCVVSTPVGTFPLDQIIELRNP